MSGTIFNGIKQVTKQGYLDIPETERIGTLFLVRDIDENSGKSKSEEIYFGNRKYSDSSEKKIFIGTEDEYNKAHDEGRISVGALVIILDENESNGGNTTITSLLGTAVLGKMLLGQK
jgi:hypothetical protein